MSASLGHSSLTSISVVLGGATVARACEPSRGEQTAVGATNRMLVLGHRGMAGTRCGENSVRAVETALALGADGVEIDVRLASDGILVCSHDAVVRTPGGQRLAVSASRSAQLRGWTPDGGERLATLQEVLAAVSGHGTCRLVVEAKPTTDHRAAIRTAEALAAALDGVAPGVAVTVSSFEPALLGLVRSAVSGSGVHTALLGAATVSPYSILRRALDGDHDEAHLNVLALREAPHVVRLAHSLGVAVTAWTVNSHADLLRLAALGVDAVITDAVVPVRALMRGPLACPREGAQSTAC